MKIGGNRPAAVLAGFACLFVLASLPVLSVRLPPLFDYPNHLARMSLLADDGASPVLAQFYQVHWAALPNLAMDLIVPCLSRVMPLEAAGRVFLLLGFLLTAGGLVLIHRALFRFWSFWPLAGFLLLYNRIFLWGFVNYLFGIGVLLVGVALWLLLENHPVRRVLVSALVAVAVFFCHIAAFGLYALVVAGLELPPVLALIRARGWPALGRRLVLAAIPFAIPAVIFLWSWQPSADGAVSYAQFWRKADLLFSVFDNYSRVFDVICFALFAGGLIGLAAWRRLGLDARMRWPLLLVFLGYLALPSRLYTGAGADHRVPVALFLLLIAGSAPRWPGRRFAVAVGAAIVAVLVLRLGMIEHVWRDADRIYAPQLAALDALPSGSRIAVAFPGSAISVAKTPEIHLATLAIAMRQAFVPTLFAFPAQQPILLRPPFDGLATVASPDEVWSAFVTGNADRRAALLPALAHFDYAVFADRAPVRVAPVSCLDPVFRSDGFQIFRVVHQPDGTVDCR